MYIDSTYNYIHNFRRLLKYATMKVKSAMENGWTSKLRQTRQVVSPSLSFLVDIHIIPVDILDAWFCCPDGCLDENSPLMHSVAIPFKDIKPVWASLTSMCFPLRMVAVNAISTTSENCVQTHPICWKAFLQLEPHVFNRCASSMAITHI